VADNTRRGGEMVYAAHSKCAVLRA